MSLYLVLDGPDGCGKSVQTERLAAWLGRRGRRALHLREPGSTPVGESLRKLLLAKDTGALSPWTEALLFHAARTEMIERIVRPALAEGTVVLAERCYLSTWVYQGLAHDEGIPLEDLAALTVRSHGECLPDRVWLLDVPTEVATERRGNREADRFEERADVFHRRVRDAYLTIADSHGRAEVIDASRPLDDVTQELSNRLEELLEAHP